jgi:hypothetical protein
MPKEHIDQSTKGEPMTNDEKEEQAKRVKEKLERLAQDTGGRSKPEDDWKEEQKLRRLR